MEDQDENKEVEQKNIQLIENESKDNKTMNLKIGDKEITIDNDVLLNQMPQDRIDDENLEKYFEESDHSTEGDEEKYTPEERADKL